MSHLTSRRPAAPAGLTALALTALALAGCGGGGTNTAPASTPVPPVIPAPPVTNVAVQEVYVADAGLNNVHAVGFTSTGTPFTLGAAATLPAGSSTPADIALDFAQKFVLVASSGGTPRLSSYAVNSDYSLSATPSSSVILPSLSTTTHTALSTITVAGNEYAYVAGSSANALYAFQINTTTGALTAIPNAAPTFGTTQSLTPSSLVAFSPAGSNGADYLLVGYASPTVADFTINANGTLTQVGIAQAGTTGPVFVAAPQSSGRSALAQNFVYAYDNGIHYLYAYTVTTGGVLTEQPIIPGAGAIASLAVSPGGNALYLTPAGGSTILSYPIPTSGTGAGLPGTPVTTTVAGASFQAAATNGFSLGALDAAHGAVDTFALNSNGTLGAAQLTYTLPAGSQPVAVVVGVQAG